MLIQQFRNANNISSDESKFEDATQTNVLDDSIEKTQKRKKIYYKILGPTYMNATDELSKEDVNTETNFLQFQLAMTKSQEKVMTEIQIHKCVLV